jgi:DNA-binding transcriptional MerR regulator
MRRPKFVTNEELIAVTGVSRQSLNLWVKRGLLPAPTRISDGKTGIRSRWPAEALERAHFIVEARKFYALHEIEVLVRERWGDDKAKH